MGVQSYTGLHYATLDEKGRLLLPVKLRSVANFNDFILVKGNDQCLWLFPREDWFALRQAYLDKSGGQEFQLLFERERQRMLRRFNQYEELSVDASHRVSIGAAYRRVVDLDRLCVLVGMGNYLELWSEEAFRQQLEQDQRG